MRKYLKNREFLQNFENRAGDKLKLSKRESPARIGRVGMSGFGPNSQKFLPHIFLPHIISALNPTREPLILFQLNFDPVNKNQ